MKTIVLLCSVILSLFVSSLNTIRFRPDYKYYKEIEGFLKYHEIPANWREARLRCHLEGSKLATPLNSELKNVMLTFATNSVYGIYTGLHYIFSRGDYFSVEGVPLAKIPQDWNKGEPDNRNDEEGCIIMKADGNGSFSDRNCTRTFPYVCYKKDAPGLKLNVCNTWDSSYFLDDRTGSCYKFHQFPRTWPRAYMTCAAENAYLAVINSEAEGKALGELFLKKGKPLPYSGQYYWDTAHIGFHDWGEHGGQWITIHGDNLKDAGYDKFQPGEPNNYSINFMNSIMYQFCGGITKVGTLDDMWCERRAQFICEKDVSVKDLLYVDED
ncbi:uncharacterized protein LOC113232403 isoform X2 [Hyposmocoma kahamanoa]|uniref:uncharacterized protein LOC113232403 isoform X2 n=1 Tax=Hyposmocoma kahamanoa TaxID=1477025 RepID=UPI000E6D9118|nr:uncharacterized protein LOC113232403 isoform X2 [Hyposmocoma kahamanoa]